MNILVTGATGFLGGHLVRVLSCNPAINVLAATRSAPEQNGSGSVQYVEVADLNACGDWQVALERQDVVIHCAAAAHVSSHGSGDALGQLRKTNVEGTLNLAQQAISAGVKRFIFISSIGVNGDVSTCPFTDTDLPSPGSSYAVSKHEAEQGLKQLLSGSPMELVIIRAPLVYGWDAPGKFGQLLKVVEKGWVLPLGRVDNKRGYVALDNIVDLVVTCVDHPSAANRTLLVSDGEDLSTTELLRRLGAAFGKPVRLLPVPVWVLTLAATTFGKKPMARTLCGDLQIDISHTCETLNWQPPVTVDEALKQTADAYRAELSRTTSGAVGSKRLQGVVLRVLDVAFSALGLTVGSPVLLGLLVVGYFDNGSPLFRQQRVGRHQRAFTLVKFRTMRPDTASVATHLADGSAVTRLGRFMRKTKLDELPQLWNVLKGDMSLVGPRPGLFNQKELTAAREQQGVFAVRPGITGLAQINNIDMSTPELLAETDRRMLETLTVGSYFKYILRTVTGKGAGDAIRKS